MRVYYFKYIRENGVAMAREMSFLVEQGNDAVFSDAHRSARDTLIAKMEMAAAKSLSTSHLEEMVKRNKKRNKDGRVAADSDEQSD